MQRLPIVTTVLVIALGATLGALLRHYVSLWAARTPTPIPYATLAINVAGSMLLGGFLAVAELRLRAYPELRLLVATGFCGSFTTFSTFSAEIVTLLVQGRYFSGMAYAAISVILGVLGAAFGIALARGMLA